MWQSHIVWEKSHTNLGTQNKVENYVKYLLIY